MSGGVRTVVATIEPFTQYWREANQIALAADGPLWIVVGDSSSVGIGASHPTKGYVGVAIERLTAETGEPWRVINLGESGARVGDAMERQIPLLHQIIERAGPPALVTASIGTNDVMFRVSLKGPLRQVARLGEALPPGSVVTSIAGSPRSVRVRSTNEALRATAAQHGHRYVDVWGWPGGRHLLAADRFHLNDAGYVAMADALLLHLP